MPLKLGFRQCCGKRVAGEPIEPLDHQLPGAMSEDGPERLEQQRALVERRATRNGLHVPGRNLDAGDLGPLRDRGPLCLRSECLPLQVSRHPEVGDCHFRISQLRTA